MSETCMCWGIACGDGWYDLLDNLCGCIQSYIDNNKSEQVEASQVKEKFGGLRFYTSGCNDLVFGMIWMAEYISTRTCEVCGKPGKLRGKGWLYTSCEEHKREEK